MLKDKVPGQWRREGGQRGKLVLGRSVVKGGKLLSDEVRLANHKFVILLFSNLRNAIILRQHPQGKFRPSAPFQEDLAPLSKNF